MVCRDIRGDHNNVCFSLPIIGNITIKGVNVMTIYKTRYAAHKAATSEEKTVKVDGGYAVMTAEEYRIWRLQK